MNILFIATKSPWPAVDGGRLLMAQTLAGLAARGHRVTVVAPAPSTSSDEVPEGVRLRPVAAWPRPFLASLAVSQLRRRAISVVRHGLAAVRREVARALDEETYDVVHVEQLQAMAQAEPALERGLPVVLRAQNVESDLWAATGKAMGLLGLPARLEAARMARAEGKAVARAHRTAALTSEDAARLRELSSGLGTVNVVRAAFVPALPAADKPLSGKPTLVLLASRGWLPNRDAADWFASSVWPVTSAALPDARLHIYGGLQGEPPPGVLLHDPPGNSREVFAPGSVQVVPLRIGSGVRMKILEAWARGIPVVSTPQGIHGLEARDGHDVLVARDAEEFAAAFRRLQEEPGLADSLVDAGRASLVARHDPAKVTEDLLNLYQA